MPILCRAWVMPEIVCSEPNKRCRYGRLPAADKPTVNPGMTWRMSRVDEQKAVLA